MSLTDRLQEGCERYTELAGRLPKLNRRGFLKAVGYGVGGLILGKDAYSAESNKTVDEILEGTRFKQIGPDEYWDAVKNGKVVLFYYTKWDSDDASKRLAEVYKEVIDRFPEINFLCMSHDETRGKKYYYEKFNIPAAPYSFFFNNLKEIYKIKGGPKEGYTKDWIPWMKNNILEKFYK